MSKNPWIQHVQKYAKDNNINYAVAMNDPSHKAKLKESYTKSKKGGIVKVAGNLRTGGNVRTGGVVKIAGSMDATGGSVVIKPNFLPAEKPKRQRKSKKGGSLEPNTGYAESSAPTRLDIEGGGLLSDAFKAVTHPRKSLRKIAKTII